MLEVCPSSQSPMWRLGASAGLSRLVTTCVKDCCRSRPLLPAWAILCDGSRTRYGYVGVGFKVRSNYSRTNPVPYRPSEGVSPSTPRRAIQTPMGYSLGGTRTRAPCLYQLSYEGDLSPYRSGITTAVAPMGESPVQGSNLLLRHPQSYRRAPSHCRSHLGAGLTRRLPPLVLSFQFLVPTDTESLPGG